MVHLYAVVSDSSMIFFILRATLGLMMSSVRFEEICPSALFPTSSMLFLELFVFLVLSQVLALLNMFLPSNDYISC